MFMRMRHAVKYCEILHGMPLVIFFENHTWSITMWIKHSWMITTAYQFCGARTVCACRKHGIAVEYRER
jgi:hypothetical protein